MTRLWAKREEQIHDVVETMAGLDGDLQGIAGRSLLEVAVVFAERIRTLLTAVAFARKLRRHSRPEL
jgi:hypothetical protein